MGCGGSKGNKKFTVKAGPHSHKASMKISICFPHSLSMNMARWWSQDCYPQRHHYNSARLLLTVSFLLLTLPSCGAVGKDWQPPAASTAPSWADHAAQTLSLFKDDCRCHRTTESSRLEKAARITSSNWQPIPTTPANHVSQCRIHPWLERCLQHLPGHPVPMYFHSFCEEFFPNIQPEPPGKAGSVPQHCGYQPELSYPSSETLRPRILISGG